MDSKFKCCKKDFNNFCCIVCTNVFHTSCLERKKKFKLLDSHKIYCSEKCEQKYIENKKNIDTLQETILKLKREIEEKNIYLGETKMKNDDLVEEMKVQIDELKNEIKEKDMFINRLKRRTQDFEDDVGEAEEQFVRKINEQKETIVALSRNVERMTEEHRILQEEMQKNLVERDRLKSEMQEITDLSRNMITTIRILEDENELYRNELHKMRQGLQQTVTEREKTAKKNAIIDNEVENTYLQSNMYKVEERSRRADIMQKIGRKNKIMILCDQQGRNINKLLQEKLVNFNIETVIKPGACFGQVIEDITCLIKDYTTDDYVIIIAGKNDFTNHKTPLIKQIFSKIRYCSNTNIILVPMSYGKFDKRTKKYIFKFNNRLNESASILDRYSEGNVVCMDENISLFDQKRLFVDRLVEIINCNINCNKNLTFVRVRNLLTDCLVLDGVGNKKAGSECINDKSLEIVDLVNDKYCNFLELPQMTEKS